MCRHYFYPFVYARPLLCMCTKSSWSCLYALRVSTGHLEFVGATDIG